MYNEKLAHKLAPRHWWPRTRLHQPSSSRWVKPIAIICIVLVTFHWVSSVHLHRIALLDKFSPTVFTHLTQQDKEILESTSWRWDETNNGVGGSYSRSDAWASRNEWKRLGSGSEGEAFTYNGTVIKVYKAAKFPFRNCVPNTGTGLRWPTEIAASLLLGGMVDGGHVDGNGGFLPVTDYFLSPATKDEPPRWHFLTPFLPSGSLVKLAEHLHHSEHAYTAHDLDVLYRPSLEHLLDGLDRMHSRHELCHDDVKPDNIFLSGRKSLAESDEGLDVTKNWMLADLGNAREPSHPYHSSILWSELNNNLPDCRVNDVLRLLKSYMLFLRAAVDDVAAFDKRFFEGQEPWAILFWSTLDAINRGEFVSAISVQVSSKTFDVSHGRQQHPLVLGRSPPGLCNPLRRLFLGREQMIARGVSDALRISATDGPARRRGLTFLLGVPVADCQVES
ncbi:hypothetical protein FDECE_4405 [Fusarium decemcellulare]|nr:hypothetical protein FDECE_4405 [Fusarium decemcellulare]